MKFKNLTILVVLLIIADQVLKVWIKTHLALGEAIPVFEWFQLRFVENNGAAFGMQIAANGGYDWGKLLLGVFRVAMVGVLTYALWKGCHMGRKVPKGVLVGGAMVLAGALGNIIDSAFYGMIFTESTPMTVAQLGEGYSSFMFGRVVDMFYFPLFKWDSVPGFLSFLVDRDNYFFGAIFNLADAYISVAVVYLIVFQHKFFNK